MLLGTAACSWVESFLKPISPSAFGFVALQIMLSSTLEVINCYAMYKLYFQHRQLKIYKYSAHCFSDKR